MIFPILTRACALNLRLFNSFLNSTPASACFCISQYAAKSWELNELRIQAACLGEFHSDVLSSS